MADKSATGRGAVVPWCGLVVRAFLRRPGLELLDARGLTSQLADDLGKAVPLHKLHRVEMHASIATGRVDRHDVGMVKLRRGLSFDQKPLPLLWINGRGKRKDFEGDLAAQRDLLGLVNHAHAASTNLADDPVVSQPCACGQNLVVHLSNALSRLRRAEPFASRLDELQSHKALIQGLGNRGVPLQELLPRWRRSRGDRGQVLVQRGGHPRIRPSG